MAKEASTRSIEITPEMVDTMQIAMNKKDWTLYRLCKETGISYNTILDIFKPKPTSNYRHLSKMQKIYTALEIELPEQI